MTSKEPAPFGYIHKLKNGKVAKFDNKLKDVLNSIVYNINNDWDFVIIITGNGMVRTGKSVLGLNVGAWLADQLGTDFDVKNNICFDSQIMIDNAQKAPKHSVFVYDEAREGLATSKRFSVLQQDLVDFFNECGQLNHIFILILPDFFELQRDLATHRSEFLLNVYRQEYNTEKYLTRRDAEFDIKRPLTKFNRGYFEFYSRKRKQILYFEGKKNCRIYNPRLAVFRGKYGNNYPIDEAEYKKKKKDMLERFKDRHKKAEEENKNRDRDNYIRLRKSEGATVKQIEDELGRYFKKGLKKTQIYDILATGPDSVPDSVQP